MNNSPTPPRPNINWLPVSVALIVVLIIIIVGGIGLMNYVQNFRYFVHNKEIISTCSSVMPLLPHLLDFLGAFLLVLAAYVIIRSILIDLGKFFEYLLNTFSAKDQDNKKNDKQ